MTTMARQKFATRPFLLREADNVERAIAAIRNAPLDPKKPLQVVIREEVKARKLDQQGLMWAGPLADIAAQAWVAGRQFDVEIWHDHFKREFLPEEFDPELCLDGYCKWAIGIIGDRVLIGSTTQLTIKGMAQYLEQVYAFGANLGVQFHAKEAA